MFRIYSLKIPNLRNSQNKRPANTQVMVGISKRSFPYVGAKVWNDIPNDIRNAESTHLFKLKMKTYLWG